MVSVALLTIVWPPERWVALKEKTPDTGGVAMARAINGHVAFWNGVQVSLAPAAKDGQETAG